MNALEQLKHEVENAIDLALHMGESGQNSPGNVKNLKTETVKRLVDQRLTVQETSTILNLSDRQVRRLLSAGHLTAHRVPGSSRVFISHLDLLRYKANRQ